MLCTQPRAGLMTQTLKSPFSYNYTDSSYAREYGTWTMVTGSVFLVPDKNFLCYLLLTHCTGDVEDSGGSEGSGDVLC